MSTTATANRRSGGLTTVVVFAGLAALGGFLFGYDSAVINGAIAGIKSEYPSNSGVTGFVVSADLPGAAVGAAVAGSLANRFGRLGVQRIAGLLFAVSSLASAVPFSIWDLTGWRMIAGVAIGLASVTAPAYIADISPDEYRGRLASFQQLAIVLGIVFSQVINYVLAQVGNEAAGYIGPVHTWGWMFAACAVPAFIYLGASFFMPESPRYLLRVGRTREARRTLVRLRTPDIDGRLHQLQRSDDDTRGGKLSDLFEGRRLLPIVLTGATLSAFQQLVGINVIFYYSSTLWQSVGVKESNSLLLSLFTSVINLIGTFIAISLVDKLGRRPLLLAGSAGMTVSLALVTFAFTHVHGSKLSFGWGALALAGASFFVLFFALSWGVVVWVLLGEMFPLKVRPAAMSVATATQWIANWLVTLTFPTLGDWNLAITYGMYTVFAALSFPFVLRRVPETKGRSLESMA